MWSLDRYGHLANMTRLGQRDTRWGGLYLGNSNTYIRDYGCTVTCLAMILGTTPDVVNQRLRDFSGFSGNLVIWEKIERAFPGIKVKRVWGYNNDEVKANVGHVLVEVPAYPIGGSGRHWVVYLGNQRLNDPWTALERPTSDFPNPSGYCVLSGTWNASQPIRLIASTELLAITDGLGSDGEKLDKVRLLARG
jgi:hypothetical protein